MFAPFLFFSFLNLKNKTKFPLQRVHFIAIYVVSMTMSIDGPGKWRKKKTATTTLQRVALLDHVEHFLCSCSQYYNVVHVKVDNKQSNKNACRRKKKDLK